ncbi:MAG: DegT/DnrJ/EryC1/StrS family aminotransferase [Desulfobacterota bacterium]|jgi:perosamine synthetase|nr:DegT/DnrJ/EryC1/StrS family aminotransferase [Thermodesulfobacteriota bacterium]
MIPVNEPLLDDRDLEYVTECVRSGWISSAGRFIDEFEEQWAAYCGVKHGISVSNGTVALQTAVACLGLEPGFQVIMPAFTIISCALAVIYNGGVPVLVDSDPRTWCMDVSRVEEKITGNTRAIMPVHIYGHPVDMDPLRELAARHGLSIVEDAAEAHGAEYLSNRHTEASRWLRCGGMGHLSCFSFYANKLITTGEGGMVLTNDPVLSDKARSYRNLCFRQEKRFYHTELGNNYRLTNLQAALGLAQIERMEAIIEKKRWIGKHYTERLKDIPGAQLPVEESWARQVYWMYGMVLDKAVRMDATEFADRLKAKGVETRPFFLGMHEQPALQRMGLFRSEKYPVAERLARQGLYLPSGLTITESQIDQISESVREVLS